jgi:hypothetical protein
MQAHGGDDGAGPSAPPPASLAASEAPGTFGCPVAPPPLPSGFVSPLVNVAAFQVRTSQCRAAQRSPVPAACT